MAASRRASLSFTKDSGVLFIHPAPFGIRARPSTDGGRTWEPEIILRADGGGRDVSYSRSVQRADGKVVTVYYFHDTPQGNRYIAATI